MATLRDRLTRLHPASSLLLIAMSLVTALLAITVGAYDAHMAVTVLICLLPLLWAHGIYDRANSSEPDSSGVPWVSRLFIATELALIGLAGITLAIGVERLGDVLGGAPPLILIPYFACFWFAAAALSRAEGQGRAASGATLGTFLLVVYWVIGIWFIRPRLRRLNASVTPSGTPGWPPSR